MEWLDRRETQGGQTISLLLVPLKKMKDQIYEADGNLYVRLGYNYIY